MPDDVVGGNFQTIAGSMQASMPLQPPPSTPTGNRGMRASMPSLLPGTPTTARTASASTPPCKTYSSGNSSTACSSTASPQATEIFDTSVDVASSDSSAAICEGQQQHQPQQQQQQQKDIVAEAIAA